jgi:hypothetical protein
MHLTYFGDFVSLYLALLNAVDPENIDYINILKAELAKAGEYQSPSQSSQKYG